jgi:hypothetical protein
MALSSDSLQKGPSPRFADCDSLKASVGTRSEQLSDLGQEKISHMLVCMSIRLQRTKQLAQNNALKTMV